MARKLLGAMMLLLACTVTASAGVVIDNFDAGNVIYSGPGTSSESGLGANTLGGTRETAIDISLTALEINDPGGTFDSAGICSFGNDPGIAGTLTLTYHAATARDLTSGGADKIMSAFLSADQPATLAIQLTDSASNSHTESQTILTGSHVYNILLSAYSGAGVDTTDITDVVVTLKPDNLLGGDYFLTTIETTNGGQVPEPAGLFGIATGLVGLVVGRRRS